MAGLMSDPFFAVGQGLLRSSVGANPWAGIGDGLLMQQQAQQHEAMQSYRDMQMQEMQRQQQETAAQQQQQAQQRAYMEQAMRSVPPELQAAFRANPALFQKYMEQQMAPPQQRIVKGADGNSYYENGQPVLPGVAAPEPTLTPRDKEEIRLKEEALQIKRDAEAAKAARAAARLTDPRQGTDVQNISAGYYERMAAADDNIRELEASGYSPASVVEGARDKFLPNVLTSEEGQKYQQAQADWVRAKLRKESGAVIADEEMASEIKTYFPQIGDGPAVIKQKAEARRRAVDGMKRTAGPVIKTGDGWTIKEK